MRSLRTKITLLTVLVIILAIIRNIFRKKLYVYLDSHPGPSKIDRVIGKTRVISPGSLGQPRDGKGYGSVIFDLDQNAYEFIDAHVPSVILKQEISKNDPDLPKLFDVLSREEKKEK